jgi:hypothetical protein
MLHFMMRSIAQPCWKRKDLPLYEPDTSPTGYGKAKVGMMTDKPATTYIVSVFEKRWPDLRALVRVHRM